MVFRAVNLSRQESRLVWLKDPAGTEQPEEILLEQPLRVLYVSLAVSATLEIQFPYGEVHSASEI